MPAGHVIYIPGQDFPVWVPEGSPFAPQASQATLQAESQLAAAKETMTSGFSEAEMSQAMQSILGAERAKKASTAGLMTRGGGTFDPKAFARATAGLTGQTQQAIGGLHAQSAAIGRQGTQSYLNLLMQISGMKTADIRGQTQEMQQAWQGVQSAQQAEDARSAAIWGSVLGGAGSIGTAALM